MKSLRKYSLFGALTAAALAFTGSTEASITGQWDFKSGNLNATIGSAINVYDSQSNPSFGTTATFGISPINGSVTNVLGFPTATGDQGGPYGTGGLQANVGASGNEGGNNVNQYTVIMDVLFPSASLGKVHSLFVADQTPTGAEVWVTAANALAIGTYSINNSSGAVSLSTLGSGGTITPDVWHRIAVTVDITNNVSALYLDGSPVVTAGTTGGLDGPMSIGQSIWLFNDPATNSVAGYVASLQFQDVAQPAGFIAEIPTPVVKGILNGPAPNPFVVSVTPTSNLLFPGRSTVGPNPLLQIVLQDGAATVVPGSVVLKFNGATVAATVNRSAPVTTISYQVPGFLAPQSSNFVALTYSDSAADALGVQYAFDVGPYVPLPATAALPVSAVNTPGMIYRVAKAPEDANVNNNLARALQQLDGTLLDTNGVPYANLADTTPFNPDGTVYLDVFEGGTGTAAFEAAGAVFYQLPTIQTYQFPGIPGTDGGTSNFADDVLAYLQLNAGTYVFGVDVGIGRVDDPPGADDGYALFCGANPRDAFSTLVGQFVRTGSNFSDRQNTNQFTFVAPVAGVYPFRLVHWQVNGHANLGWYYVDPATGNKIAINDLSNGNIPAFRVSTVAREPYVSEVSPAPGGAGFAATAPIQIVLGDDGLQVAANSIGLFLNGTKVTPNSVTKSGSLTTILYNPNASRSTVTNNVTLVYSDNAATPKFFTNNWSFTIVVGSAAVAQVTGQWDFKAGNLTATVGKDLVYFDGPSGTTAAATKFGTCSSFGIPAINGVNAQVMFVPGGAGVQGNNNFGYVMNPQIAPNGGGTKVNQYTIIWDIYYTSGTTLPLFQCQNTNNSGTDGSIFLQNGQVGQGSGGYVMKNGNIGTGWHRVALSVDLAQNLITKWVDGVKAQDWVSSANSLDTARRAWQPLVLLFADGDGDDHSGAIYVNSIQVRNGRLNDSAMAALGAPNGAAIPQTIPNSNVTGQWDFTGGNLNATIGADLQYLDGTSGTTAAATQFGTCTSFSIPTINGVDAKVMFVPGGAGVQGNNNFGYIMSHGIAPNGGGLKVNQYTVIWDMYYAGGTLPLFNCQNTNNAGTDGSIFLQNGQIGQGSGGYVMNHGNIGTGWHRVAMAVDLSQNLITKWVDGVKAQDWVSSANGLDTARRAWQNTVLLFADGDGDDHNGAIYVRSIQVSNGKLSDAAMVALGAPDGNAIPVALPATSVTGQWDFNFGNLAATIGKDLQYLDGASGTTAAATVFGTCSTVGIPLLNGVDAKVMEVPGGAGVQGNNNFGYVMQHLISPNAGGLKVNQYTIIWDMYYQGNTLPLFNCQNTNNSGTDGSIFLQNGQVGQGSGGYVMLNGNITTGWHRIALAADLSQNLITKWVDGVKAQDWVSSANALDTARRAWQPTVLLFADGDGDDHNATVFVKSIQVNGVKLSDAYMQALGGPSATGIPQVMPTAPTVPVPLTIVNNGNGTVTLSWPGTGWILQSKSGLNAATWGAVSGVGGNSVTLPVGGTSTFFRLIN